MTMLQISAPRTNYTHSIEINDWDFPICVGETIQIRGTIGTRLHIFYLHIKNIEHLVIYDNGCKYHGERIFAQMESHTTPSEPEIMQLVTLLTGGK